MIMHRPLPCLLVVASLAVLSMAGCRTPQTSTVPVASVPEGTDYVSMVCADPNRHALADLSAPNPYDDIVAFICDPAAERPVCLGLDEQACWEEPLCHGCYGSSGRHTEDEVFKTCSGHRRNWLAKLTVQHTACAESGGELRYGPRTSFGYCICGPGRTHHLYDGCVPPSEFVPPEG